MKPLLIILGGIGIFVSFSPIVSNGFLWCVGGLALFVLGLIWPRSRRKRAGRSKQFAAQNGAAPAASDSPTVGSNEHAKHKAGIDPAD